MASVRLPKRAPSGDTKFWEDFVDFPQEKLQNIKFTKFSSVRTPEIY